MPADLDPIVEARLRHAAKDRIRKSMRGIRRAIPAEARAKRSSAIADRVRGLPAWEQARVVAGYVAMRGEVDPAVLVREARAEGREVALPRVDLGAETIALHRAGDALEESGMGFLQPPADSPRVQEFEVDLVLVPALAADERGHRIGWGKGFYDRLLPLMPRAVRVALVFDFQLVAEVPDTQGDERVDWVVTDARAIGTGCTTG